MWKAARGRNFLHELNPRLSNSSLGPCPAAAGRASVGPWDSPVVAEPGALQAAALGPQTLPQGEGQYPGGATISLDKSYRLSETQFPHWLHGGAAVPAPWGCSEIHRGHTLPSWGRFYYLVEDRSCLGVWPACLRGDRPRGPWVSHFPLQAPAFPNCWSLRQEQECSQRQELWNHKRENNNDDSKNNAFIKGVSIKSSFDPLANIF